MKICENLQRKVYLPFRNLNNRDYLPKDFTLKIHICCDLDCWMHDWPPTSLQAPAGCFRHASRGMRFDAFAWRALMDPKSVSKFNFRHILLHSFDQLTFSLILPDAMYPVSPAKLLRSHSSRFGIT